MKVKKLLEKQKREVVTISPDATVYDALKLMAEKEIGALVVESSPLKRKRWWGSYQSGTSPVK